ncbi:hypothetical protein [Amycolatopsis sp. NPDC004079]|uniref:hypothetical protein n=1 Tax=Amycolatopsis sp. NPDC004079 TaxID=3154549 RepID=UPI0033A8D34D
MRRQRRTAPVGSAPDDPDRHAAFTGTIPSKLTGFDFEVCCTVAWNGSPAWSGEACDKVASRATSLLRGYSPVHADLAGTRLAADLAAGIPLFDNPPARVCARNVVVTVDPDQLELAQQRALHLREREVAAAKHEVERAELEYLKETVFKDTASAALWWLHRNDYDVAKLSTVVQNLNDTVKIVTGGDDPGPADLLITALDALAPDLDQRERYEIHHQLVRSLSSMHRNEQANSLLYRIRDDTTESLPAH